MKQIIKIHIEYELAEDEVKIIDELSKEELEKRRNEALVELRRDFDEFPDESIKEFDVYISKD